MNNTSSPIPGIDLSSSSAMFAGERYVANAASPESIRIAAGVYAETLREPRCTLVMLRASAKYELEVFLEPSPIAYCLALLKTGLRVAASLVYYGDDFVYRGQDEAWSLAAKSDARRDLADVAGVALSLTRYKDESPTTFLFVDRTQLNTAKDWFLSGACAGMMPDEKTIKALMLNAAIRYLVKWVIDEKFKFPTDFSAYFSLLELHKENELKASKEAAIYEANAAAAAANKYRTVKNIPSVTEALMNASRSSKTTAIPLLKTFEPEMLEPIMTDDFESFGL